MVDDPELFPIVEGDEAPVTEVESLEEPSSISSEGRTPYLVIMSGPDAGRTIELGEGTTVIGRRSACDITLMPSEMSRRHAQLTCRPDDGVYWLEDLSSTNGTFVGDERIEGRTRLEDGDRIRFGSETLSEFMLQDEVDESFYRDMREKAVRDRLTGVYSQDYVATQLRTLSGKFQDFDEPLYIALADLDDFEEINDTYGHPAGDAALETVGEVLREVITDVEAHAGRYGGDEFLLIVREPDERAVEELADRLVRDIDERRFEHEGRRLDITASVGVASTAVASSDEITEVLYAADRALYESKAEGGNTSTLRFGPMSADTSAKTLKPL